MTLPAPHRDWKLDILPVPLTKAIGSDEMLTQLWLRVAYDNEHTTRHETPRKFVAELASKIEGDRERFEGFVQGSGIAETWLRADLVKVLKRTPDQFAVARPVHLAATKLRNTRKEDDAHASYIPYRWLELHDPETLGTLKSWISVDATDGESTTDLPSYALALLAQDEDDDTRLKKARAGSGEFLCDSRGRFYAADLKALLAYRQKFPRPVLVDHVRRLTSFHLALHLMETYAAVVDIDLDPDAICHCDDAGHCRWMPELVADCGEDARSSVAKFAEESWAQFETTLARYVRAHLKLRKLHEFAGSTEVQRARVKLDAETVRGLSRVRPKAATRLLDDWSRLRIELLVSHDPAFGDVRAQYAALDLSLFDIYMALLYSDGERRWFKYHRDVLDSVLGKNDREGLMRQPLGGKRRRRVVLSAPLLETLVLAAMVQFDSDGVTRTRSLRVDELVDLLANRYGLLVAAPPAFAENDPAATRWMIENHRLFRGRLRQAGLFVDQSDAFLTQTIRPRVEL